MRRKYFHICWFADPEKYRKSKDPLVRKQWIQMVLTRGTAGDIRELKDEEIRKLLDEIMLPQEIRNLWERYFQKNKSKY